MSWRPVARLMARDARRSRGFLTVVGLFALAAVAAAALPAVVIGAALSAEQALPYLVGPLKLVVGLTGLLAGHAAIAGPRSGGQLMLLLGQPVDRGAFVIGAFVGRAAVVLGGVGVGVAVIAGVLPAVYGDLPAWRVAGFGGLLGLYAVSMTALAIGLSATAGTRGRAAVGAVGAFVLFEFFWGVVPAGAHYLVEGSLPGPVVPAWLVLLERIQPMSAFEAATALVVPGFEEGIRLAPEGGPVSTDRAARSLADRLGGPPPGYLDPWASVAVLVGWSVAPLVIGWHRFRQVDL